MPIKKKFATRKKKKTVIRKRKITKPALRKIKRKVKSVMRKIKKRKTNPGRVIGTAFAILYITNLISGKKEKYFHKIPNGKVTLKGNKIIITKSRGNFNFKEGEGII